jgi:hypothetical protein
LNRQRSGFGILNWPNGAIYQGDWAADNRQGKGSMIFSDKSVYVGTWFEDKKHGLGKYTWQNGQI